MSYNLNTAVSYSILSISNW